MHRGADALSDAELLAIFLRTGTPGRTAVDVGDGLGQGGGSGIVRARAARDLRRGAELPLRRDFSGGWRGPRRLGGSGLSRIDEPFLVDYLQHRVRPVPVTLTYPFASVWDMSCHHFDNLPCSLGPVAEVTAHAYRALEKRTVKREDLD